MKKKQDFNTAELNDLIKLSTKILKFVYILIFILGIYAIIMLFKETGILSFIAEVLRIISPLFIGLAFAWIFDPIVKYLVQKGIKRIFGVLIVYAAFLALVIGFFSIIIPTFSAQLQELSRTIPSIVASFNAWIDNIFIWFGNIEGINHVALRAEVMQGIENFGQELPKTLPLLTFNILRAIVSGLGIFMIGLVIGFYVLISYENATDIMIHLVPKQYRKDLEEFSCDLNTSLRGYIRGVILLSTFVFITTYIAFSILGLKGALIFALLCGLTNIIPYIGPYIGGSIAAIVGFSQSVTLGLIIIALIIFIQAFESIVMHPLLMGKSTKLHPVSLILGLLFFGYYFGIIGMILATPIIAFIKVVFNFVNKRINFLALVLH